MDKAKRVVGRTMTDEEVLGFIRDRLRLNPHAPRTRLLKELRSAGQACEQGRFAGLYTRVQEEVSQRG